MLWHHRQWQPNSPRRSSFSHSVCSHCLCSQLSCSPSLSAPAPSQKLGPHTNSALQQCSLASCCECPGRCYTELPPSLAGRLHTHCNQAGHICVCVRVRECYKTGSAAALALSNSCSSTTWSQLPANGFHIVMCLPALWVRHPYRWLKRRGWAQGADHLGDTEY